MEMKLHQSDNPVPSSTSSGLPSRRQAANYAVVFSRGRISGQLSLVHTRFFFPERERAPKQAAADTLAVFQVQVHTEPSERAVRGARVRHSQGRHRRPGTRNTLQPKSQVFYVMPELLFPFPLASVRVTC